MIDKQQQGGSGSKLHQVRRLLYPASADPPSSSADPLDGAWLALELLETVPVARDAALDSLTKFFSVVTQLHFTKSGGGGGGATPLPPGTQDVLESVRETLGACVRSSPKVWLRPVFKWAASFLVSVCNSAGPPTSKAYFLAPPVEDSCHTWLLCLPTSVCISLLLLCLDRRRSDDKQQQPVEDLVSQLMIMVSESLPHAEWIVSHVGTKRPELLVPLLVESGVQQVLDACDPVTGFTASQPPLKVAFTESLAYVCRCAHGGRPLVTHHLSLPLHSAITSSRPRQALVCLQYVLHCADRYPPLLSAALAAFAARLEMPYLEKCIAVMEQALEGAPRAAVEQLVSQAVGSLLKDAAHSYRILAFLLRIHCVHVSKHILKRQHAFVNTLLYIVALEVQRAAQSRYFSQHKLASSTEQPPLLREMGKDVEYLCEVWWVWKLHRQAEVARALLRALCIADGGDVLAARVLLGVMGGCPRYRHFHVYELLLLVRDIGLCVPNVYRFLVARALVSCAGRDALAASFLASMLHVLMGRSEEALYHQRRLVPALLHHLPDLAAHFLAHPSEKVWRPCMRLLALLDLSSIRQVSVLKQVCGSVCGCCLRLLQSTQPTQSRTLAMETCLQLVGAVCGNPRATYILLHGLADLVTSPSTAHLLGGRRPGQHDDTPPAATCLLLEQNRHVARGKCATGSSSAPLGRPRPQSSPGLDPSIAASNRAFLLRLLSRTLRGRGGGQADGAVLEQELTCVLAERLRHHVCPDVLSCGDTTFPDMDSERLLLLERDLRIFARFQAQPVLWDLLELVSAVRPPVLATHTILLYPLLAVVANFWEGCREARTSHRPHYVALTVRLLDCLRQSQLIPAQLGCLREVVGLVAPYEASVILACCWNYVHDNPPGKESYTPGGSGSAYPERKYLPPPSASSADAVHLILLANISRLGFLFPRYLSLQAASSSSAAAAAF